MRHKPVLMLMSSLHCSVVKWRGCWDCVQVLLHHGAMPACKRLLAALAARTNDSQGHVHTWYWAAALAQHARDYRHALLFFKRSAHETLLRPHLLMQAKALLASVECILGAAVAEHAPSLTHQGWELELQSLQQGHNAQKHASAARGRHAELCRNCLSSLSAAPAPTGGAAVDSENLAAHAAAWPGRSALATAQMLLRQALEAAHRTGDDGVELRALMSIMFVLRVEGALRVKEKPMATGVLQGGYEWSRSAAVKWLEGSPEVSKLFVRWQELLSGYRRNVVSLWRLIGVGVVLDADSWWGQGQNGPIASR